MPLNNPEKRGLKSYTLKNQTKDVVKVGPISIPAGDELTVSEEVARQMVGQGLRSTSGDLPDRDQASPFPAAVVSEGEVVDSHPTFDPPVLDPDGVIEEHPKNKDQVQEAGGGSARERSGRRK